MEKLVVVIMGQDCERFIEMAISSVIEADAIVYCDGGSIDNTIKIVKDNINWESGLSGNDQIIHSLYDQEDKGMNGKQRNFYLDYVKQAYPNYWCLAIDADEVVEDLSKIKEFIQEREWGLYSVKMRHLIGDLSHEDYTAEKHVCLNRLFKISEADKYPEVEHPVLQPNAGDELIMVGETDCTTIWHMAYVQNMWEIKKRYDNHSKKSNMHTPEFLKRWYHAHLFGSYPRKQFNPTELPKIILDKFGIDKDELYFANRGLEMKHFQDAIHWKEFFKPSVTIEFGCGKGPRVYAMNHVDIPTVGVEISEYAVKNSLHENVKLGALGEHNGYHNFDLVIAYDVLEHLKYENLSIAIDEMISTLGECNGHILISVPYKGTPNCEADSTHIIKEDRDWWVKQFTDLQLKEVEVPEHFSFREQLLIFTKF